MERGVRRIEAVGERPFRANRRASPRLGNGLAGGLHGVDALPGSLE